MHSCLCLILKKVKSRRLVKKETFNGCKVTYSPNMYLNVGVTEKPNNRINRKTDLTELHK
ncbi:hypothetical protein HanIR_Chr13g0650851 [Helianthus annuus]|nr:hypothetical protein HanIR_Chr13g0650851 [Helianthus annuus]